MKQNIAYIISLINKSVSFEWIAELLDKDKFNLTFILLNDSDSALEKYLKSQGINTYRIKYSGKKDIITAFFQVRRILKKEKIKIVHAHLFEASLIGLLAAKTLGIKKRLHTRHNSTIHHYFHPHAVKYDKFINLLSTQIIAVSGTVKNVLVTMENVNPEKIKIVHHGFKLEEFENIREEKLNNLKEKYKISSSTYPVIGVISRYIEWKGVQYIIPAFEKLLKEFPNAHLILANAEGPYTSQINSLLKNIPKKNYTEITFEEDIFTLYHLFDLFIHTPIDDKSEAFGQVYVEAMASGVPSIVTLSGIATDYIINNINAIVVPYRDTVSIYKGIKILVENKKLSSQLILNGKEDVKRLFPLEKMMTSLEEIYLE